MASRNILASRVVSRFLARIMRLGFEHSSPEARKDYLKEHPRADPSLHTVKKHEKSNGKSEEKTEERAKKPSVSLFSAEEKKLPKKVTQKSADPDKLFEAAKVAHEQQLDWLNRGKGLDKAIGGTVVRVDKGDPKTDYKDVLDTVDYDKPGPIIMIGPMKTKERAKKKIEEEEGGDYSVLADIVRASVAVDSFDQIGDVMKKLRASGLKLANEPTDRFEKPTEAGYRDIKMNVVFPNGHVGELQVHLKPTLQAKEKGHKFYETVREIQGKKQKEGRDVLTDEEQKAVDEANAKMKDLYDTAWKKATGGKKEAMITKVIAAWQGSLKEGTKYYKDDGGTPVFWNRKRFPMKVVKDKTTVIWDLEKFFQRASVISKKEFDALVEAQKR
jgi:hypothetical protein